MREKFSIPIIEQNRIGPQIDLPDKEKSRKKELREREGSLSRFILERVAGATHIHSRESTRDFGHTESIFEIEEEIKYLKESGFQFACFTEHSSNPVCPEKQSSESEICKSLINESEKIVEINKKEEKNFFALSGVETNIMFDENGEAVIDTPNEVLEKLDLVIASRHVIDNEKDFKAIEKSLSSAVENEHVDVIGHPDRAIKFHSHDWNYFCKLNPEAKQINKEIRDLDKKEDKIGLKQKYKILDKIIGKREIDDMDSELTKKLNKEFQETENEYWTMWDRILDKMKENNKAFEINFNSFPAEQLVKKAVEKELNFFLSFDAHDFHQYKKEKTELTEEAEKAKKQWAQGQAIQQDLEILEKYKADSLSSGVGFRAVRKFVKQLKKLDSWGVKPDRIINSSPDKLLKFLSHKNTKNLKNLTQKINTKNLKNL